jgi:RNA polymerase sigma factor (sigma-70 family)
MGINEDLAAKWQAGDRAALEDLYRRCEGLRVMFAVRFARYWEHDERMAEADLAFMRAANGFRDQGHAFGTLLKHCIANHFHQLWQRRRAKKRTAIVRSLDAERSRQRRPLIEVIGRVDDVPANAAHREELAEARRLLSRLPPRYREIVLRHCAGESLDEIGASQGVTREAVRKVEIQAMTWLRMSEEEFAAERLVRKSLGAKPRGSKPMRKAASV